MKKDIFLYYDSEGDYVEVKLGKLAPSFFDNIGDDIFVRKDRKTNEVRGYAIFNVKKRNVILTQ